MRAIHVVAAAAALSGIALFGAPSILAQQGARADLRLVESFASIADSKARSVAIFEEAGRVIAHPRCVNCHPATERPLQLDSGRPHQPPVFGAASGMGSPSMPCTACHGRENFTLVGTRTGSIPGHPKWHLAPLEMAWEGKTLGAICRQIKDPGRNGGKDLAAILEHMAHDDLVGWGWNPGAGRTPVPGTQESFGLLIKAWIDTGAECPAG